jgi:hypothetical protein
MGRKRKAPEEPQAEEKQKLPRVLDQVAKEPQPRVLEQAQGPYPKVAEDPAVTAQREG